MTSLLDVAGLDTRLARALLEGQAVEYAQLHAALTQVRSARLSSPRTLALELLERGLLEADALEAALAALVGQGAQGWQVGAVVAGLEIRGHLGTGGMGQVFLARDTQTGSEVAVKTLILGQDDELFARFQREAEAQARVDGHRNVVRIHRSGLAAGRAFLVMDAVSGGDLGQRLAGGPLEPQEAASLVAELARGLAHAHARGVLHRDLKPENVLFDETGAPRLADFGLARLVEAQGLTQTGQILGTPGYMAPEQATGGAQDERTDVYGLGGVLYAALTGTPPFSGGSVLATLDRVLNEPAPDPRATVPTTPTPLAELCLRALSKSPEDRFPSAQALAEALESFLAGDPRPGWSRLSLGVVFCCALLGGLWLGTRPSSSTPNANSTPSPSRDLGSGALDVDEVRDRVRSAGTKLAQAQLAESFLARELEPADWLEDQARTPFLDLRMPAASRVRLLPGGRFLVGADARLETAEWGTRVWQGKSESRPARLLETWREDFLALSPGGTRMALAGQQRILIVDLETLRLSEEFAADPATAAVFVSEDTLLLLRSGELTTRRLGEDSERPWGPEPRSPPSRACSSKSGLVYVAFGRMKDFALRCYTREGALVWSSEDSFSSPPRAVALSPDERWLALGAASGGVLLFDAAPRPPGMRSPRASLAVKSPDTGPDRFIQGRAHQGGIRSLVWLPGPRLLSIGGDRGVMNLWDPLGGIVARDLTRGVEVDEAALDRDRGWIYLASAKRGRLTCALAAPTLRERPAPR